MTEQVLENIEEELHEGSGQPHPVEPPSIRDSLASALEESKAKAAQESEPKAPKVTKGAKEQTGRERDESGKFQPKIDDKAIVKETVPAEIQVAIPKTLSPTLTAEWGKLSPAIQKEISKREEDFHRELTKHDEERVFGKQIKELSNPYLPTIKAEGGDLVKAFGSFLNTAYALRTQSPQEKGRLLLQLAQEFGADMRGASQPQTQTDPRFNQVLQELQQVKSTLQQEQEAKKQQEEAGLNSQIEAFKSDPKHPHFETVKADMAALLRGGIAKDLDDAYDRAVYANPQTRSTLLQQQSVDTEEKRLAEKKAKAEQAKKAGSSIKGAPGMAALKNGRIPQADLRSELRAAFASHREG